MKKIFLSFAVAVLAIGMSAQDITAFMTIQLKSQSNNTNEAYLFEASDFQDPVDATNCSSLFPYTENTGNVNVFLQLNGANYSQFAAKTIKNLPIGIITNREAANAQNYQLIFSDVEGRNLKFYDRYLDSLVVIPTAGLTYDFTINTTNCPSYVATTNVLIADRFVLEPTNLPEPSICHQYGNLIITGHKGEKVKVLDMADQVAIAEQTLASDSEVISLSALTKGEKYQVIVGDKTMIIRVQ